MVVKLGGYLGFISYWPYGIGTAQTVIPLMTLAIVRGIYVQREH